MLKNFRKKIIYTLIAMFFTLTIAPVAKADEADAILGEWYTENNKSIVKIYKQNEKYYGKIIWLKKPLDKFGRPKTDKNNPDDKKKSRLLLNLVILTEFEYDEDDEWDEGEIYNPEDGELYSCNLTLTDKNTLDVRGYIGISLIGKTTTWKRKK